jgi:hypothetical protein
MQDLGYFSQSCPRPPPPAGEDDQAWFGYNSTHKTHKQPWETPPQQPLRWGANLVEIIVKSIR